MHLSFFFVAVYFLISYIKDVKKQKLPFGKRKR
ncbi:small membrane protein [Klebsiella pneumoniae]|nr:small membrane protein [Klebsiella pneumoniae]